MAAKADGNEMLAMALMLRDSDRSKLRWDANMHRSSEITRIEEFHSREGSDATGTNCHCCGKDAGAESKCGGCKTVCYCGKNCQKDDWKVHKALCPLLKAAKALPLAPGNREFVIQLKMMSHCNSYPTLDDEIELEEEQGQKPLANMYQGFKAMLREKEKAIVCLEARYHSALAFEIYKESHHTTSLQLMWQS